VELNDCLNKTLADVEIEKREKKAALAEIKRLRALLTQKYSQ